MKIALIMFAFWLGACFIGDNMKAFAGYCVGVFAVLFLIHLGF
jgi:hypothetical protein